MTEKRGILAESRLPEPNVPANMPQSGDNAPLVSIVILNTNRKDDTLACLATIEQSTYSPIHTIVLDNASSDGSVAAIRAIHPSVEIIRLDTNKGYAGNNNVGLLAAQERKTDWIFVLNEDTLLASDCIEKLIQAGERSTDVGIVGPLVFHADEPNIIQSAGGRLDRYLRPSHIGQNEKDNGQYDEIRRVDWISGCALLIRREVVDQIGPIDERFFYYWEETEWCLRARKAGWQILHAPDAKLWHKGVQRDYEPSPSVTYYSTRNRLLMLAKHRASVAVWAVAWHDLLRTYLSWSMRSKWRHLDPHRTALRSGVLDFLRQRWGPART